MRIPFICEEMSSTCIMKCGMKRFIFVCVFGIIMILPSFGQDTLRVRGVVEGKYIEYGLLVKMLVNDTVYQSIFLDSTGYFEFLYAAPSPDYKLAFCYLAHPVPGVKYDSFHLGEVDSVHLMIDFNDIKHDEIKLPSHKDTYYYYGYPAYSDSFLRVIALKYGFRYQNLGCFVFDEDQQNREMIAKFNKLLGRGWREVFYKDVRLHEKRGRK